MEVATRFALRRFLHGRRQVHLLPSSSNRALFSASSHPHPPSPFLLSSSSLRSHAPVPVRLRLFNNLCPMIVEAVSASSRVARFKAVLLCWNASGRKLLAGSIFGLMGAGMITHHPTVAYADDYHADHEEPSGYLGDELHTFWSLSRKFQLPIVLLTMVLLGWRHPITLAVNVAMLLFCTRPEPLSVYMFIEQMRQRDMKQEPRLHKSKHLYFQHLVLAKEVFYAILAMPKAIVYLSLPGKTVHVDSFAHFILLLYTKRVEVEDYKLLCLAKVQLRDAELHLVGVLGGWWVCYTTRI